MDWIRIGDILMAHFAELDDNNIVKQVIVVHNNELLDDKEIESEWKGIEFCIQHFGGRWVQTSYNANIRKNYAGIGFSYDETLDAFIPPKCHDEAILNEATAQWNCENGEHYVEIS
jgi:hypothetical protein